MNTTAGKGASSPPPRRRPSARAPGEADSRERRARSAKRESAGEIYAPERGEVFFEEKPQPFSVSLREILEEYRSDSGPDRYAMAVELEEPGPRSTPTGTARGSPIRPLRSRPAAAKASASRPAAGRANGRAPAVGRKAVRPGREHPSGKSRPPKSRAAGTGWTL